MKGLNPSIPLSLLFIISFLPDLLCLIYILARIEFINLDKQLIGKMFPYYIEFEYSHSLILIIFIGIFLVCLNVEQKKN